MEKSKILCVITFFLTVLPIKAQDASNFIWAPLKLLELRQFHYNTAIPVYGVGLKIVEEPALLFPSRIFFSEKPNGEEEGYYAANTSKLSVSIGDKKNKKSYEELSDIGEGWKGIAFEKPLYILKGDANVRLQNMVVCLAKTDYAKLTGKNIGNQSSDNSSYHQNNNISNSASLGDSNHASSLFSLEKPYYNTPNQSKSGFTTPEKAGYTLLNTKTIAGFKCDYYLEGVRTFRFGNGDFVTFPDGKDDGYDNRKPSRNHSSLGDWQLTADNGSVMKCQNGIVKVDFPSGYSISNKYESTLTWKVDDAKPRISIRKFFGDLLYVPNQNTPLTFYDVKANINEAIYEPFTTYGYLNNDRIYYVTEEGVVYPYKQKVDGFFISSIASDTIIKAIFDRKDRTNATLELKYSNGDIINCVFDVTTNDYLIKSGTIHRNGGVLSVKEVNGRVVKVLTFPNGDKYAGEFKYEFENKLKSGIPFVFTDRFKLSDLSLQELQYWNGTLIKANGKRIVFEEGKTEQQKLAERQAQNAKTKALYNQLCKEYGQKYVDAALAQTPIVGMPEKLLQTAFGLRLIESGTYYKMYRINGLGWKDFGRTLSDNALLYTVWVRNGRVTDVRYWGN